VDSFGPVKQAAVLVALYQREGGEMEVILTTRAKHLRRHPSQTVCPLARLMPSQGFSVTLNGLLFQIG
jgi:hypothetical protein